MLYEIEPLDNFFFRGPEPFEAGGETTVLHGSFPPLPSVYAGAFRTFIRDKNLGARGIKVGFNGLMIQNIQHFPMPLDVYLTSRYNGGKRVGMQKSLVKTPLSSYPLPFMLSIEDKDGSKEKEPFIPYIAEKEMSSYIKAEEDNITCIDIGRLLRWEDKLGIEVDSRSGTSKNQQIYSISCVRPELKSELKLAVDIKADLLKESGVIKLGGEGKIGSFRRSGCQTNIEAEPGEKEYFKLYLATPAIFRNGWFPGWLDKEQYTGIFSFHNKRVKVRLLSACVGKRIPCGGFGYGGAEKDLKGRYRPREQRLAVPAGSVYYFQLLRGTYADAVKLFHGKCLSNYREGLGFDYDVFNKSRYCDRGFGYSLVGKISEKQEEILHVR